MPGGIHSGYVNILEEMLGERRLERPLLRADERISDAPQKGSRAFLATVVVGVLGLVLGISSACATFFFLLHDNHPVAVVETSPPHDGLVQEIALMKQILSGLVGAVQNLEERSAQAADAVKSVPQDAPSGHAIRVFTEHANLRLSPDKRATILAVVPQNTFLLSDRALDGWYRVTTPLGEQAWISGEVVSVEKGP